MADVRYMWRGPEFLAALNKQADKLTLRAANLHRNAAIELILNTPKTGHIYGNHQASAPGEPPASDTGALVRSIRVDHTPGSLRATVIAGTNHAMKLEFGTQHMAPRPFMLPSGVKVRPEIEAMALQLSREIK